MWFRRWTDRNVAPVPEEIEHRVVESENRREVRKSIWRALYDMFRSFPDQDAFTKEDMEEMKRWRAAYAKESQRIGSMDKMQIHHKIPKRKFKDRSIANRIWNLFIMSPLFHRDGNFIDDEEHYGEERAKKVQEDRKNNR